jgi:hypothetical protein
MRFIFDCENEVCLPAAYELVEGLSDFLSKVRKVDVPEDDLKKDKKAALMGIVKNCMVKYPGETSAVLGKLWILDEGESAPNVFVTVSALFSNQVAIDFFTSVVPSLLAILKEVSPTLSSKN